MVSKFQTFLANGVPNQIFLDEAAKRQEREAKVKAKAKALRDAVAIQIIGIANCVREDLNSIYMPTSEVSSSGMPLFKHIGKDVWLEYWASDSSHSWQLKAADSKGTDTAWASVTCSEQWVLPQNNTNRTWSVCNNGLRDCAGVTVCIPIPEVSTHSALNTHVVFNWY